MGWALIALIPVACVDPAEIGQTNMTDILVVDGTVTNLDESQIIWLNRAQPDRLTGRLGTVPITQATVDVWVDSSEIIHYRETANGRYLAPDGFKGKVGHSYQLRFSLADGTRYQSTTEVMPAVPAIDNLSVHFNPNSLAPAEQLDGSYAAAHEFYIDFKDPVDQVNFYRWDWVDWEQQEWCHTCNNGIYQVYKADSTLLEDCMSYRIGNSFYVYDYHCRTPCWEIIYGSALTLFSDRLSNGGLIQRWKAASIPLFSKEHALVELRQRSLTAAAYLYFKRLQDQTQRTGGVTDTPPAAPIGNVFNSMNPSRAIAGYFTASAVWAQRYWLTRNDATGYAPGLFMALNGRDPSPEGAIPGGRYRPPLAVCVPSDTRTPVKPKGWQE